MLRSIIRSPLNILQKRCYSAQALPAPHVNPNILYSGVSLNHCFFHEKIDTYDSLPK